MALRKKDYLSQLPDEVIINILSRLTLVESGRTSVLSRRWQHLWLLTKHCSGPSLIFKPPIYDVLYESGPHVDRKRLLYIGLLNKVFKLHQQPFLDEFVVSCWMSSKFSSTINNWIKFALAKGVQRLELTVSIHDTESERPYVFPSMQNVHFRGYGIPRLRDLCLIGVRINQKNLDALLSTCPLLESLSLSLWGTGTLNVSSVKLKHLKLFPYGPKKWKFEISAPSLISFGYKGYTSTLHFKCIPRLCELDVWDREDTPFFMNPDIHLGYISRTHLKKLTLLLGRWMFLDSRSYPMALPRLAKLEEFEVNLWGFEGDSFLWPTVFIPASPFLRRFCAIMENTNFDSSRVHSEEQKRRINEGTKFTHQFLKVVEIRKFGGWSSEMELAQRLIDIGARSLEKVIVDTRSPRKGNCGSEDRKKLALSLERGLDSSVDLVVL